MRPSEHKTVKRKEWDQSNVSHSHGCTWMVKVPLVPSVCRWISICAVSPPAVISLWRSFSRASLPLEISSLMNTYWDVGQPTNQPEKKQLKLINWNVRLAKLWILSLLPLSPSTKTWQRCPAVFLSQPEIHVWRSHLHESGVKQYTDYLLYQMMSQVP